MFTTDQLFSPSELAELHTQPVRPVFAQLCDQVLRMPHWQYPWEWAEEHCRLTSETSAEVGRYSSKRTPYIRELMEVLNPRVKGVDGHWKVSETDVVVFQKGAQLGGTLAFLYWVGAIISVYPSPILAVFPTLDNAKRWSRIKLGEMLRTAGPLRKMVYSAKDKEFGSETLKKYFPGGNLLMIGSNSAAGMRQVSVRFIGCDDFDGFAKSAGDEGSPLELVMNRQATFSDSKVFLCSTPTIQDESNIEHAYTLTDQRKFFVPCPYCEKMQWLQWKHIDWPSGKPEEAVYICEHCKARIENKQKNWMLPRGRWHATNPEPRMPTWRGYHLSSLYSPHGWKSWGECAKQFVAAKGNPQKLQVFTNTVLAETWSQTETRTEASVKYLLDRRETYPEGDRAPAGAIAYVAAIDVQIDRLEVLIDGYGIGHECWHLKHHIIEGNPTTVDLRPNSGSVWRTALELLAQPITNERYGKLPVMATCIDTGAFTQAAYHAVMEAQLLRHAWWAVKGKDGTDPIWPRRGTEIQVKKKSDWKMKLYTVCVDSAKANIYDSLTLEQPGPGFHHYPMMCDEVFFDQLMAERRVRKYVRGFPRDSWEMKPGKKNNEILDLSVYALAALTGLEFRGLVLDVRHQALEKMIGRSAGTQKTRRRGSGGVQL